MLANANFLTVCLSLLGTWSGEPWQPYKSTILQLLVSIQSMIFCEEPWYNEPGRERTPDNKRSQDYNNRVRGLTMEHAIIPRALHAEQGALWDETAQVYLRAHAAAILDATEDVLDKPSDGGDGCALLRMALWKAKGIFVNEHYVDRIREQQPREYVALRPQQPESPRQGAKLPASQSPANSAKQQ